MAKDKSLKSKPHKRKDLGPSDDSTEIMDTEVNTKRKKMDADVSSTEYFTALPEISHSIINTLFLKQEAPAHMSQLTNTTDDKKRKKNKKSKKEQVNQTVEQAEVRMFTVENVT